LYDVISAQSLYLLNLYIDNIYNDKNLKTRIAKI